MPAGLYSFENNDHFFIKFFLLDATLNLNKWGVTENALRANLDTFIGKPFILTPDFGHPDANNGDHLLKVQDDFKVGTIIEVGIENDTHKAFGIAEITKRWAVDVFKKGTVSFVSPSIVFGRGDTKTLMDGYLSINRFEGAHVAGVKDPAFGMFKSQIKGQCSGDAASCEKELAMVQASKVGKILTYHYGEKTIMVKASDCVEECIQRKSEKGVTIDDQAIAICLSECGESKGILKKNVEPYEATVNEPGKPDKKCNIDKGLPCVNLDNASNKQKKGTSKTMTSNIEEEEKRKEEEAQDEEEKKKEEEARKARAQDDEKDKIKMDSQDEEEINEDEKAEDDEDEKKEDAKVRKLQAQINKLNRDATLAKKEPIVHAIVEARMKLNLSAEKESEDAAKQFIDLPEKILLTLKADYESMATRNASPKYPYETEYAKASRSGGSRGTGSPDLDHLLQEMKKN